MVSTQSASAHSHRNSGCAASSAICSMRSFTSRMSAWLCAPLALLSIVGMSFVSLRRSSCSAEEAPLTNSPDSGLRRKGLGAREKPPRRPAHVSALLHGPLVRHPCQRRPAKRRERAADQQRAGFFGQRWSSSSAVGTGLANRSNGNLEERDRRILCLNERHTESLASFTIDEVDSNRVGCLRYLRVSSYAVNQRVVEAQPAISMSIRANDCAF